MKELVEYIAKSLVEDPSQVNVVVTEEGEHIRIELTVAKEDMGRIIGKGGRVPKSNRTLLRVAAAREGKRASLDVIEP